MAAQNAGSCFIVELTERQLNAEDADTAFGFCGPRSDPYTQPTVSVKSFGFFSRLRLERQQVNYGKGDFLAEALLLSTTTSFGRVRGFTVELLFHLKEGPLRTRALCQKTEKSCQYVETYLYRMQEYGLVMKNDSFWNLTTKGQDFTTYMKREEEFLVNRKQTNKQIQHLNNKTKTKTKHLDNTVVQKVEFQSRFDLWLQNSSLNDIEKEVVDQLVSHYKKTKQKFILVASRYELAERLNVNPETLQDALRQLYQDRIAYCVRFQGTYWKIGLYVSFLESLEKAK